MSVSPFDSGLYGVLLSDAAMRGLIDDRARLAAMLQAEAALARAEARLGIIPAEAGSHISDVAGRLVLAPEQLAPEQLAKGTASDGVPVPALVKALKQAVGAPHDTFVHWGATSQDIADTGLVLCLREVFTLADARLETLCGHLAALARTHRDTVMAGRTRFQLASPTTFGLKAAVWLAPLLRHRERIAQLLPRLCVASFAGASGSLSALGAEGPGIEAAFAAELRLGVASAPWHSARDTIAEAGSLLAMICGSLGKAGMDVLLLAQNEVAEARPAAGGASSTMPHKANPVQAEVLVALARTAAEKSATLMHAMVHAHERDGTAWMTEWMALPELCVAAGAALQTANALFATLAVNRDAMAARVMDAPGLLLSESAAFALAAHMPRAAAEALVKAAVAEAAASGRHVFDILAGQPGTPVDWQALRADPAALTGSAGAIVDRVTARC